MQLLNPIGIHSQQTVFESMKSVQRGTTNFHACVCVHPQWEKRADGKGYGIFLLG